MKEFRCNGNNGNCNKLLFKADNIHNYLVFQQGVKTNSIDLPAAEIEIRCKYCKKTHIIKV